MSYYPGNATGSINLQATVAASSSVSEPVVLPHHPITCTTTLSLTDDGAFACEHATVPAGDVRTQACIDHSIALLLIQLLAEREMPWVLGLGS